MDIEAQSRTELANTLADIDITVRPRTSERAPDHHDRQEQWIMYRALATLMANGEITYPVRLSKRQRPDYLLIMGGNRSAVRLPKPSTRIWPKHCRCRRRTRKMHS